MRINLAKWMCLIYCLMFLAIGIVFISVPPKGHEWVDSFGPKFLAIMFFCSSGLLLGRLEAEFKKPNNEDELPVSRPPPSRNISQVRWPGESENP